MSIRNHLFRERTHLTITYTTKASWMLDMKQMKFTNNSLLLHNYTAFIKVMLPLMQPFHFKLCKPNLRGLTSVPCVGTDSSRWLSYIKSCSCCYKYAYLCIYSICVCIYLLQLNLALLLLNRCQLTHELPLIPLLLSWSINNWYNEASKHTTANIMLLCHQSSLFPVQLITTWYVGTHHCFLFWRGINSFRWSYWFMCTFLEWSGRDRVQSIKQ